MILAGSVLAVLLASVLGGATGFASSLLATPLLLIAGLDLPSVVVVNLVATLVSRLVVLVREREHVDRRRVLLLGLGSAPGAWCGAVVVGLLDPGALKIGAGALVAALGVVLLLTHRSESSYRPGRPVQFGAGLLGGCLSTSTSLNGPPVAILLQNERLAPVNFIADLAAYFVVTNSVSLLILAGRGQVPTALLWPALPILIVAAVVGNQLGRRLTTRIPAPAFRIVVIVLVIASGLVTALG